VDIIYTTESLIVINPTDGQTSSVIAKDENELFCFMSKYILNGSQLVGLMIIVLLTLAVSSYALIVNLQLQNLMGKLMIFYHIPLVCQSITAIVWCLLHQIITLNSQIACHTIMVIILITSIWREAVQTCTLTFLTNLMYRCYKLKSETSKRRTKFLLKCYAAYAIVTVIFYIFLIAAYD